MRGIRSCAALALLAAAPLHAAWQQATTPHFIIYADEAPAALTARAAELEAADATLRRLHDTGEGDGIEGNRLTIFVTRNLASLKRIFGDPNSTTAGFYLPRASGSVAFTPLTGDGDGSKFALKPKTVLMHEYGHHFLLGNYAVAYPAWFSEGYAEFVGTIRFDPDQIVVGQSANHRAFGLFADNGLSLAAMFDPPARLDDVQTESIYARGWALTHYLMLDPKRAGQLTTYLAAFNGGMPPLDAARKAFGDLKALDKELDAYVLRRRLPARGIPRDRLPVAPVTIRPLSAGEAAMIETRMLSTRGVGEKTAPRVFDAGTKVATLYPDDPVVQGWYAEMALDAGRDDVAEQAADRALKLDPTQTQALLYKARIRMQRAAKGKATPADWKDARSYIIRANKQSNDNAQALAMFYDSYVAEGKQPTKNAVEALVRAQQLVPQAPELRARLVGEYIRENRIREARAILLPLAYDPHAGSDSQERRLLDAIDAKADHVALERLMAGEASSAASKP